MASKSCNPAGKPVTPEAFARDVARRRAEAGPPDIPCNSGERRTESKKALLRAIKDAGGEW